MAGPKIVWDAKGEPPVDDKNGKVLPGHNIKLKIKACGKITKIRWEIDGHVFQSYQADEQKGEVKDLPEPQTSETIEFYWSNSGTKTVKVNFDLDDVEQPPLSVTFSVAKANVSQSKMLIGNYRFEPINNPQVFSVTRLNAEGVVTTASLDSLKPDFEEVEWGYFQIIPNSSVVVQNNAMPPKCGEKKNTEAMLDTHVPYRNDNWKSGSGPHDFLDSPLVMTPVQMTQVSTDLHFDLFVMMKPSSNDTPTRGPSAWVALAKLNWSVNGCGEINAGKTKVVVDTSIPGNWVESTTQPSWEGNISQLQLQIVTCPGPCK